MISGAKGSSQANKTPRSPVESPNTLRSKNVARVIDALCEGPIKGLVNGLQSIFFDDTPLQNEDGTFNFEGVNVETRTGEPDQEPLKGFPYIESEINVGVKVVQATPVVRTIADAETDFAMVKVRIPQLTQTDTKTGDIRGTTINFNIEVRPNGGSYTSINYNYQWKAFTGTVTSALAVGIRFTANATVSGKPGTSPKVLFTAQYRAVGSGTWLTIEARKVQTTIPGNALNTSLGNTASSANKTIILSSTFEITGLAVNDYEIRLLTSGATTTGTIKSQQNLLFNPITITGKTTSPYEAAYRVPLPAGGAPWDIRLTRVTADSASVALQNDLYWSSYIKVTDVKMIYPDTALVGLEVDAESFGQNVPTRSFEIEGLLIKVPSNYDPETRIYTGIWDGTFDTAYSNNPAWVLYDLLTNTRYGLGDSISTDNIDKAALYDIGVYCDELVDDGFGDQEPRFTFNGIINDRREAYDVVNAITSTFRGMSFWSSGSIGVAQDAPADPVKLVVPANVIDGNFAYAGSALKTRHTSALITWNDPEDGFRANIAVVEDIEGIDQFGWKQVDTAAIACTSRGQAVRFGRWMLDTERYATETILYRASLDHADVYPGQIILVADPFYANVRHGGRCLASTTVSTVVLDQAITLDPMQTYTIWVTMPDGSVEEKGVTNTGTTTASLSLTSNLSADPVPGATFVITASNVEPRQFRVLSNREIGVNEWEISALFHDPTKYDRVEGNLDVSSPSYSLIPTGSIGVPTGLAVQEYLYQVGPSIKSAVSLSWTPSNDSRISFYEIYVQGPNDPDYIYNKAVAGTSVDILDTFVGHYSFRVRSMTASGVFSTYLEGDFELLGLLDAPSDVENFSISIVDGQAFFSWNPVQDLDLKFYRIKYTPNLISPTWGSANPILPQISKDATGISLPLQIGSYLIKAVDTSDVESENAAIIITAVQELEGLNFVVDVTEDPGFTGTKTNVVLSGGGLELSTGFTEGTYYFANDIDLGAVYTSRLTPIIESSGVDQTNLVDDWANVDLITNWDGSADPAAWELRLEVRTTPDNPAGTPTWSDWQLLLVSEYTARAFEFRVILYSKQPGISPHVTGLTVNVDMPDRIEAGDNIAVSGSGVTVSYSSPFKAVPALVVTGQSLSEGDRILITAKTVSGFHVQITNGGVNQSRTIDFHAKGYGVQS